VSEPPPTRSSSHSPRSLLQRLVDFLHPGPDTPEDLRALLAQAEQRDLIGADSRDMLEGVLRIADLTAGDVMIAVRRLTTCSTR
jgi:magnesium and cobalt transporter